MSRNLYFRKLSSGDARLMMPAASKLAKRLEKSGNSRGSFPEVKESGSQLLARLSTRPSLSELDNNLFPEGLQSGDVVQISGNSGTGKSLLLLHLLTKCLLPKTFETIEIGGLAVGVILIDTDHNISILKLAYLMEHFIRCSVNNAKSKDSVPLKKLDIGRCVEELIKDSLNRLVILKTYSSLQLQMNFHSLSKILSTNSNISLLMIDSLTSYYWEERMNIKNYKKMDLYLKVMIDRLLKCIKDFKIITVFVKQEYFQSKHGETKSPHITHEIDLKRDKNNNDLFYAFVDSVQQSSFQYSILDEGFTWIVN